MGLDSCVEGEDHVVLTEGRLDPVEGHQSFMMTGQFKIATDLLPVGGMAMRKSPLKLPDGLVKTKSLDGVAAVVE